MYFRSSVICLILFLKTFELLHCNENSFESFHKKLFLNFDSKYFKTKSNQSILSLSRENLVLLTEYSSYNISSNELNQQNISFELRSIPSDQSFSDSLDTSRYEFKIKELQKVSFKVYPLEDRSISLPKLFIVATVTGASIAVVHKHQSKAWWQEKRTRFHFQNDWEYALWIDKLGHWWGAASLQHLFSSSMRWSNFSYETSNILGSFFALSYQLYVETYDGFAPNWGFSPGDALFDFGGAFYPLVQYYYPFFKNINLKMSYYPSKRLLKKDPLDSLYKNKFVIDDYEGQSFYLSFKINNFLPQNLEKYWPDFLCLAIGYQMRNWNGYGVADQNYYFALDFDFEQIPLYGQFWQFLKNTFNLIHFPSPAIKFSKNKISFAIAY